MTASAPPAIRSIGIVLHDFPLGGTERIALRLAHAWIERGVAVTIFVGEDRGPLRALVPTGARLVLAEPPIPRGRGSRKRLGTAAAVFFTHNPVDGLFVPGNFHWEIVPALARIPHRPPVLVQISSPLRMKPRGFLRQFAFERRMRRLLRDADALIAMGPLHRAQADSIMGRAVATAIPLPALDDERPVRAGSGKTILAAGRLIHQKGFDLLIDAFADLDDPEARLVIAGSGPEEAALAGRIAARKLGGRVELAGFVPDIAPLLDEARLFVMASRFEGYGAVIVEALGAGRPVVATASTPAVEDVLGDPESGIVVPIEDVGSLRNAMRALLDRPAPDPHHLAGIVDGYRIGAGAKAYLDSFRSVLASRREVA
ncbi:glycosyltransferase [Sphingomonas oryzagri]|uniref:Glycosyltransferase n=1 Tax=Sphingomonas oryzagri TaxID=3042314 RepID=A0ABT6MZ44_9SPHN|nr:glycosyltransferase [Sphingomonas oryzagri]MDH7638072.1 glycosyltransferase [Sphingomonas oryzagri]